MPTRLAFLGTKANIEVANRRHRRHSAALIESEGLRLMLDCGADWRGRLGPLAPDAIALTHAHPDHAWGLRDGAPCPVYASEATWADLQAFPVAQRERLSLRDPVRIGPVSLEAFFVEHSTRCPAVGFRITPPDGPPLFYVPDIAYLPERDAALGGCALYVGDGSSLTRSLVRMRGDRPIGHVPVRQQLTWCAKSQVPYALFTHCGTQIVQGDERRLRAQLNALAAERGVSARFAFDGMTVPLAAESMPHA